MELNTIENQRENSRNRSEFYTTKTKIKPDFKEVTKDLIKLFRKHHVDYEQSQYLFKQARKELNLKRKKYKKGTKEHLSLEEFKLLMDYVYTQSSKDGLMVKVLLFTGARVNEFVNIKKKDVYLLERKIYLSTTKGDKPRYVPIFPFYIDELRMYMDSNTNTYLFESRIHDKYTTVRIWQIIKKFIKDSGIEKNISPHRLRGTIAVWLKEKGVSTEMIQQFLGHSKLETTQIYTQGAVLNLNKMGERLLE